MPKITTDTGLVLDEGDAEDAKILARQRAAAREAGKAGADRAGTARGRADLEAAYDEGARPATATPSTGTGGSGGATDKRSAPARPTKAKGGAGFPTPPMPTLKPPTRIKSGDWSGFLLGLVLQALVVSYIRYGAAGPKGWLKAKFLNQPIQGDDLESQNRKDQNNGVDPAPSGRGPNGEIPAEGHMDENTEIM